MPKSVKKKTVKKKAAAKKSSATKQSVPKKSKAKKSVSRKRTVKKTVKKSSTAKKKQPASKIVKKSTTKKKVSAKKTTAKKLRSSTKKKPAKTQSAKKKVSAKKTTAKKLRSSTKKKPAKTQSAKKKVSPKPAQKATARMIIKGTGKTRRSKSAGSREYMGKDRLDHFRNILSAWKTELMSEVDRTVNHLQSDATLFADPTDRATQEEEFSFELRTRDRERKLIKKIDDTLTLIDKGEYGYCTLCGEKIGFKRLEARPTASLCVDCKTLQEYQERKGTGI